MKTSPRLVACFALAASGCVSTAAHDRLVTQASYELRCPPEQIQLVDLGGGWIAFNDMHVAQGVAGCGQRLSYVYDRASSTWLRNGPDAARLFAREPSVPPPRPFTGTGAQPIRSSFTPPMAAHH